MEAVSTGGSSGKPAGEKKGRPEKGKQFGYGGGTTGKGFTTHPALTRLKMETVVQKAWWELDQAELIFYKANPTPITEANNESDDWPRGYKVENIDGVLKWKHLHRHEDNYYVFIGLISEEQIVDLETYMEWVQQQEPQTVAAVALLHGALDVQPPVSTRGGGDAMGEMAEGLRRSAELNAEVMQKAVADRAAARKESHSEAMNESTCSSSLDMSSTRSLRVGGSTPGKRDGSISPGGMRSPADLRRDPRSKEALDESGPRPPKI